MDELRTLYNAQRALDFHLLVRGCHDDDPEWATLNATFDSAKIAVRNLMRTEAMDPLVLSRAIARV